MRLNRFLALAGVASRRGAEGIILDGRVSVNGATSTDLATQVSPDDQVRVGGRIVRTRELVYILLNKPRNYLTTRSDERSRKTIYELLPRHALNLAHVGRLDKESEGLLLLTNNGGLALKLTHPRFKLEKEYLVTLDREFDMNDVGKIKKGIYLAEGRARVASLYKVNPQQIRVVLTQGMKRQVRRIFAALGYSVKRLQRIRIGPLTARGLPPGRFRFLESAEIDLLKGLRLTIEKGPKRRRREIS
jgi:23S rRNA pseudouridine2605 synthase